MAVTTAPPLTDQDVAALNEMIAESVPLILNEDWDGWLGMFTEDMIFMPAGSPMVVGKRAAKAFLSEFPHITAFTSTPEHVDGRGDYAAIRGSYTMTVEMEGEQLEDLGKWIVTARRGDEGKWLGVWDMWSSDLEPDSE
jgi:ketosteroid isomerase-like protein